MDWTRQIETTQDLLDRIVALLLSLADLAEYAAGAPDARRRLALAIIRTGESVTRDAFCVSGSAPRLPARMAADGRAVPTPAGSTPGDGPEDALALAMSLRTLALLVAVMARHDRRLMALSSAEGWSISIIKNSPRRRDDVPHLPATAVPLQWHDTS
ncbi:MAG: hypothetical protein Q8Q62_09935 [Mesorhizobium sp.]|nr:hypothetical protein [Mesorhizobium sp.]